MKRRAKFLLAVPAYREGRRLGGFLPGLLRMMAAEFPASRVVLVDDGSGSAELSALAPLLRKMKARYRHQFEFLPLPKNRGKGGAILAAWEGRRPRFEYLGFVDADGALEPSEVARLARQLSPGGLGPALFASRVKMLGFNVQRRFFRHYMGRIFATWVGICLNPAIYDSQCGLKFIPARVFAKIGPRLQGQGFAWDVELLAQLLSTGCPIREVPVHWKDVEGSKIRLLRDSFRLFWVTLLKGWSLRRGATG